MKVQNIIRMQTITIGIAAALFFATTPVHSQEITNSEFSDGPYVTAYAQPQAATTASSTAPTAQATTQAPGAVVATPVVSNTQLASMANTAGNWLIASCLFGVVLIGSYAISEVRRAGRNLRPRPRLTRIALS